MTAFLYALSALIGTSGLFNLFQGDWGDFLFDAALTGITWYVGHKKTDSRHSSDFPSAQPPQDFKYGGRQ